MATSDQLLMNIYLWIDENEECERQLRELARELESLREICNLGKCVGSSVSVVGGVCAVGGVVVTMMSGPAALLFGLGVIYSNMGMAISLSTEVIEIILSSKHMKKAKEAAKRSKKIEQQIQKLLEELKMEKMRVNPSADPDDLDQHVVIEIIKAIARRMGLSVAISATSFMSVHIQDKTFQLLFVATLVVLAVFAFKLGGTRLNFLYRKGVKLFTKLTSNTLVRGARSVVGVVFAVIEAIENWTDLIKENHVTEASKSVRDKADEIHRVTKALKDQLDQIRKNLQEMNRRQ